MKRIALSLLLSGVVFTSGWFAGHQGQHVVIRQVDDVASYNDGFMTAKEDCK